MIDEASVVRLLAGEPLDGARLLATDIQELGLERRDGRVMLPQGLERLEERRVVDALSSRAVGYWPHIELVAMDESTNSTLLAAGELARGRVRAAEFQFGGRGRRGKEWLSPIGRNLSMSLAWVTTRKLHDLEGLSLVVGLALADVLQTAGVQGVGLKWPNDVLLNSAKLAGVLIELQPLGEDTLVVIGVGVNYNSATITRARVPQPIADLAEAHPQIGRNALLSMLINGLADYLAQYELQGFSAMLEAWQSLHVFQGRRVRLDVGPTSVFGTVVGVTATGCLSLRTDQGVETFRAGEVSLRGVEGS